MRRFWLAGLAALCVGALTVRTSGAAIHDHHDRDHDDDEITLRASLRGAQEVPPISTGATGSFVATIHPDGSITFRLTYANLSALPTQSHIHFAQANVSGGVMIFLCGGDGQPACPAATSGTVDGTIVPANVVGPSGQGIVAGDLAAALRAIAGGEGYVNLHSTKFPGVEIRGQLRVHRDDD